MQALVIGAVSTIALVVASGWTTWRFYADLVEMVQTELELRSLVGTIMQLDETLTMSARMAAATGDLKWEARYLEFEPKLSAALERTLALAPQALSTSSAVVTDAANKKLVEMEHRAFSLVRSGQHGQAAALLLSANYDAQKEVYLQGMVAFQQAILARVDSMLSRNRLQLTVAGSVFLACLLALATVSARVVKLIREYLDATQRAEHALAEANHVLERRVLERTAELSTANEILKYEVTERSRVEIELRQAQKLEAVGRLASGIAHEINTPVQFVSDNLHFVRDSLRDLYVLVEKLQVVHRSVLASAPSRQAAVEASTAEERADLPYLLENVPQALDSSLEGLERVSTIVRSMKEFAHPDQKAMGPVDLNHAILSTLTIARGEYKYVAELETDLGELPRVTCLAGEVNQAVLNIVVNAAHAIADVVKGTGSRGLITIRTRREGNSVIVSIADTGGGIPEGVRERVFDPFFTTKEVGRGTGQGLAIARSVVLRHCGELTFETELGKGTTFFIRLPIDGKREPIPAAA